MLTWDPYLNMTSTSSGKELGNNPGFMSSFSGVRLFHLGIRLPDSRSSGPKRLPGQLGTINLENFSLAPARPLGPPRIRWPGRHLRAWGGGAAEGGPAAPGPLLGAVRGWVGVGWGGVGWASKTADTGRASAAHGNEFRFFWFPS